MSSGFRFNLDQSKILSSSNDLNRDEIRCLEEGGEVYGTDLVPQCLDIIK